ncbi:glutathionylspermidine synthase family protein [Niallia taxi]|uniref:glutathionylspermidine synthase family protein n=1 Tax=Niallia taxi TaxID=2499688 RepID=UPI002E22EF2B|nr:glutathionylspermidine synthase family protein [Niallia taxi]
MDRHIMDRRRFYSQIDSFWADLYGEEYALYDVHLLERKEIEKIRLISERVGHIFFKAWRLLKEVPDRTFREMGFPEEVFSFLRLETLQQASVISRLDLIPYNNSYKCIEINADTPTFIKELFSINAMVCAEFKVENPNAGMEEVLRNAVRTAIKAAAKINGKASPTVAFTAHDDNIEDKETILYLQELSETLGTYIPLHMLQIERGKGLFDVAGNQIDILYRQTFPIENLILDEDEEENKIGMWLLELVEEGKLSIINPPSAFLLQNKAVQAVIWSLHEEQHAFFTEEEHQWIENYFLPTYLEPDPFIERNTAYVKKPAFGREGDTVEIYKGSGKLSTADPQQSYTDFLPVYQQYVEHPKAPIKTEKGKQEANLLVGSFLLNGKPSAIGLRAGGTITNNLSYYLPVGIR